ncbi:MAG: hypothetical protein V1663_05630 [archaeon]
MASTLRSGGSIQERSGHRNSRPGSVAGKTRYPSIGRETLYVNVVTKLNYNNPQRLLKEILVTQTGNKPIIYTFEIKDGSGHETTFELPYYTSIKKGNGPKFVCFGEVKAGKTYLSLEVVTDLLFKAYGSKQNLE